MGTFAHSFQLETRGFTDVHDVTEEVEGAIRRSGLAEGIAAVSVPGSTAGVTTIEFEPGAVEDLREAIGRLAPEGIPYAHDARWGDGNGFAHVRAALLGPGVSLPFRGGRPRHRHLAADRPRRFRQPPEEEKGGGPAGGGVREKSSSAA